MGWIPTTPFLILNLQTSSLGSGDSSLDPVTTSTETPPPTTQRPRRSQPSLMCDLSRRPCPSVEMTVLLLRNDPTTSVLGVRLSFGGPSSTLPRSGRRRRSESQREIVCDNRLGWSLDPRLVFTFTKHPRVQITSYSYFPTQTLALDQNVYLFASVKGFQRV